MVRVLFLVPALLSLFASSLMARPAPAQAPVTKPGQRYTGAPHGGLALTLETHPAQVWKAFMFNQYEVADKMGTAPNVVDESARQLLYDAVLGVHKTAQKTRK